MAGVPALSVMYLSKRDQASFAPPFFPAGPTVEGSRRRAASRA